MGFETTDAVVRRLLAVKLIKSTQARILSRFNFCCHMLARVVLDSSIDRVESSSRLSVTCVGGACS